MTPIPSVLLMAALALGLAACAVAPDTTGGGDPAGGTVPSGEVPTPVDPCGALSPEDVSAAFGAAFGDGTPGAGTVSVNEVTWSTATCSWEAEGIAVSAAVATEADFPAGFVCVEPGSLDGAVTALDGVADAAWFTWDDFQGGEGTVIACTSDTRVEVEATGPRSGPAIDEAAAREGGLALAGRLLG